MANSTAKALYHTGQIKELEQKTAGFGLNEDILMDRAGKAAFLELRNQWPEANQIAVICGKGNNAGDGYVLAKYAHLQGMKVKILALCPPEKLSGAALNAAKSCIELNIAIANFSEKELQDCDVIVDAILGTGVKGNVDETYRKVIDAINVSKVPVLSLDLPSGLDANTGKVWGAAVCAAVTITFIGLKPGLFTGYGPDYVGSVFCDDLDLPKQLKDGVKNFAELLSLLNLSAHLPRRKKTANKGNFGHVLIVGGDYGMGGAVDMAAEAALRSGAGLVSVATRKEHIAAINARCPEVMCHEIDAAEKLDSLLVRATVVIAGPGLGKSDWSRELLAKVLSSETPKLLDADALNLLTEKIDNAVLTPHPKEAARMLGITVEKVQDDRFTAVRSLQEKYGGVFVLKGAGTLVFDVSEKNMGVCPFGNPGMASAGMGDVLSGVIGGLLAQGMPLAKAASFGVCLHAFAGDLAVLASGERGLLATDLLPHIRTLINQ